MIIYIAGPYNAKTKEGIRKNIEGAEWYGKEVLALGHSPIVPHKNTAYWEDDKRFCYKDFIRMDLEILGGCDAALFICGEGVSNGVDIERQFCKDNGIKIFNDLEEIVNIRDKDLVE